MKELSTVYADIVKVETKPDEPNFRYVHARISDETKDLDGQTADYDWLKSALPDWFKWGNVRDMHENNVVGKGKELTDLGAAVRGFDGVLKVVDPVAVVKVDEGLFTGVSIGIKGPRVINNKGANVHPTQPGRIVGGKIVEVSLVDHPCNESCKLTVLKSAGKKKIAAVEGAELELIEPVEGISPADLETYKKRFDPVFARAGVALSDGSYVIMRPEDLFLAKALRLTGFGNVVAAETLIERRELELVKSHNAPGSLAHRDTPSKDTDPAAQRDPATNPDKPTIAHESPAASGSAAAFADEDHAETGHPPTKAKKKKGMSGSKNEPDPHTHGDDTGAQGTQTDSSKGKVKQKTRTRTTTNWKYAEGDPADWSDKKLTKALKYFKGLDADAYKTATSSYPGDGRPLLEEIARSMRGRIYSAVGIAQGSTAADTDVDKPQEVGETSGNELLNDGGLMRDGDPRIGANTPQSALGQSGPMNGGNAITSPGGDAGVPNTSLPFDTAPQAGAVQSRIAPGSLPGTLRAPGDANPVQNTSGAGGGGGTASAAPPMRAASPAAQAGPDPNSGGTRTAGSPNTAFAVPSNAPAPPGRKSAKVGKKSKKFAKSIDKLAKAAVADRIEAAIPDSVKAAIEGLLKKFVKDLEKSVLVKYATADQIKALQEDIDRLGALAAPGGPFVGKIVAVDKEIAANEFAQPETQVIAPDVLEQIERFERMSKSDNRQLAASASTGLKKLLDTYFPGEIVEELTKRKRSATR